MYKEWGFATWNYILWLTFFCIFRTKILAVDLTSKQEQIKHLEQQKKDLENELQRKQDQVAIEQLKFSDLVKSFSILHQDLKTQRAILGNMKVIVQENNQTALEHLQHAVTNVLVLTNKFSKERSNLENKLTKVGATFYWFVHVYVHYYFMLLLYTSKLMYKSNYFGKCNLIISISSWIAGCY